MDDDDQPEMLLRPQPRPISREKLVVEVKAIYARLIIVEGKYIDELQSIAGKGKDPSKRVNLKKNQWQSLVTLHKQLLDEYHDFFQASSANPALGRQAAKHSIRRGYGAMVFIPSSKSSGTGFPNL